MSFTITKNNSIGRIFLLEDDEKIIDDYKNSYYDYDIFVAVNPKEVVSFFIKHCPFDKVFINTKFGVDYSLKRVGAIYYSVK